ncbi:MAG: DUF4124 domain-containing protein [Rubrivivax sp.]
MLLALLAPVPASAQVIRCQDNRTGNVTYTNQKCESGQAATEVAPASTPAQRRQEEQQAAGARRRVEREAAQHDARRRADAAALADSAPVALGGSTRAAECDRARRLLKLRSTGLSRQSDEIRAALQDVGAKCPGVR